MQSARFAATAIFLQAQVAAADPWSKLPPLPESRGVAAPVAGMTNGALLVAGGANFPDKMPWEGGKKVWLDQIWVLPQGKSEWREAGKLPQRLAYGLSLSWKGQVYSIGGCDAERHTTKVYRIGWDGREKVSITELTPLPLPLAYAAGAVDDTGTAWIACGTTEPGEKSASRRCFTAKLADEKLQWQELPELPAKPRLLPVSAFHGGNFYVFGGAALERKDEKMARSYLRDAWKYSPAKGWQQLPDLLKPCVAAPVPAPIVNDKILLLAGDDGSRVGFQPIAEHPGFPSVIQEFDPVTSNWAAVSTLPAPRATVPCVPVDNGFIIPSGEVRPGVRSAEIWKYTISNQP